MGIRWYTCMYAVGGFKYKINLRFTILCRQLSKKFLQLILLFQITGFHRHPLFIFLLYFQTLIFFMTFDLQLKQFSCRSIEKWTLPSDRCKNVMYLRSQHSAIGENKMSHSPHLPPPIPWGTGGLGIFRILKNHVRTCHINSLELIYLLVWSGFLQLAT